MATQDKTKSELLHVYREQLKELNFSLLKIINSQEKEDMTKPKEDITIEDMPKPKPKVDNKYGDLKDQDSPSRSDYVKLISSDGHQFFINIKYVLNSKTIRKRLMGIGCGKCTDHGPKKVVLELPSNMIDQACRYLMHSNNSATEFPISSEDAYELMVAAYYLDC